MALARLAFKNMGQRVATPSCYSLASQSLVNRSLDSAQKQRWGSDPPRGFSASSGDHHEKSDGREVAVSDKGDKKFKLFPRKQRKRGLWRRNDDQNFGNLSLSLSEQRIRIFINEDETNLIAREMKINQDKSQLELLRPNN
ncbi:hypothetical protein RHSIM_Rhsim08G0213800 [Rhododendron simsii]|uniref:Uncharacterized protein n=1 Tax=Rhododendron simsii TaxID=118357 RepID=A0A834LG47_RHOSS|nr:hypothetical protein RHSIM_Rhsim08G0213800 [Rhododendron simsii]